MRKACKRRVSSSRRQLHAEFGSAAFNINKIELRGLRHWLERNDDGSRLRPAIGQGGFGLSRFCEEYSSRTGSWYASELVERVRAAATSIHALPPIAEMDAQPDDHGVSLRIEGVRTRAADGVQIYLALMSGPIVRFLGVTFGEWEAPRPYIRIVPQPREEAVVS